MDKTVNDFSWKIAGVAGDGILNAGLAMFAKTCIRAGLYACAVAEYPSLIRGGHNHLDVRVSDRPVASHSRNINMLVALNKESVDKHQLKLAQNGAIIYDADITKIESGDVRDDIKLFPVPLQNLAQQAGGLIMKNTVAIGATMALVGLGLDMLNDIIACNFKEKGDAVIKANVNAAKLGYDYTSKNFDGIGHKLEKKKHSGNIFISGNEAVALGAIKAGCKFYAAYPMTPATSVLHTMAMFEKEYGIVVKHTEDEIAAINSAIGASYAGVRAMTGTSGGGFALMVEALGLAAQTETPLVIVEAQRPGPATGMPTHSGQGDLRFVLHSATDEFPRVLIAPGDIEECYYHTIEAFRLAEKYQMPAIILTDKFLGESYFTAKEFDNSIRIKRESMLTDREVIEAKKDGFRRYKITENGVSLRSIPSQKGGEHVATSYEHDETGFEKEGEEIRVAMHDKRFRKFEHLAREVPQPKLVGPEKADITIISWGSTKGPIIEAMKMLEKDGIRANFLQILYVSPFPAEKVTEVMKKARKTVIVENNKTSLMSGIIREQNGMDIKNRLLKYDGRPFSPEDIYDGIKSLQGGHDNYSQLNKVVGLK